MKTLLLLFTITSIALSAPIRELESTQMISTSGSGVGSILSVDTMLLNPASSAFSRGSTFYAGYNKSSFSNSVRKSNDELDGLTLGLYDATELARGGFMYQNYSEGNTKRHRFGTNMSSMFSAKSAFGLTYLYSIDKNILTGKKDKKHQANLGFVMVASQNATFGLVANDLLNTFKKNKTTGSAGLQYIVNDSIQIMGDLGYNYRLNFSDTMFYKIGAQAKFLDKFNARVGYKSDKFENTQGYSAGLGWNAGKLSLDIAFRDLKLKDDNLTSFLLKDEKLREITSSLTIKIK